MYIMYSLNILDNSNSSYSIDWGNFFTIIHNSLEYMHVTLNIRYDLSAINVKTNK